MFEVVEEIVHVLHAHGDADGGVEHVHCGTLLVVERAEDGAGRMDGEGAVVEEVGGTADELQAVDELEASLFRLKVDGEHAAGGLAELALR